MADADLLILGILATISACQSNIYAIHARREFFTNLYLFVTARAGSGKGQLPLCRAIVDPIHEELRVESNKLEMDYREEKERYKRQKKGEGITELTPTPIRLLFIRSTAALHPRLDGNEAGESCEGKEHEDMKNRRYRKGGQDYRPLSP